MKTLNNILMLHDFDSRSVSLLQRLLLLPFVFVVTVICSRGWSTVLLKHAKNNLNLCSKWFVHGVSPRSVEVWPRVEKYLMDKQQPDGWHMVEDEKHVLAHRILSQVIYRSLEPPNQEKNEVAFAVPDPEDVIYLLWANNFAVGFCTLKLKGSTIGEFHQEYAVTTLDTVFVRTSHRRRGNVCSLLYFLASRFGDIGFSQPISDAMLKVLAKFLLVNKQYRRTFWEVSGSGEEGSRKLIWFQLRRTMQVPCKTPLEQCTCRVAVKTSAQA